MSETLPNEVVIRVPHCAPEVFKAQLSRSIATSMRLHLTHPEPRRDDGIALVPLIDVLEAMIPKEPS